MANTISINSYNYSADDKFIVDTNVWLYLFSPFNSGGDYGYSDFFANALDSSSTLYINDLIVSEYINRLCRLGYDDYVRKNNKNKKYFHYKGHYRPTSEFENTYALALQSVQEEILPITTYLPSDAEILTQSMSDVHARDFNDDILIKTAIKNDFGIVSHDKDFRQYPGDFIVLHN